MTVVRKIKRKSKAAGGKGSRRAQKLARYVTRAELADLRELHRFEQFEPDDFAHTLSGYVGGVSREQVAFVGHRLRGLDGEQDTSPELLANRFQELLDETGLGDDVVDHWVFSWRPEVDPTRSECETVVAKFLEAQNLSRCPCVWAKHSDTDNPHLHIAVGRFDEETGARVAKRDRDIRVGHIIAAWLDDHFDWPIEARAPYRIKGDEIRTHCGQYVGQKGRPETWREKIAPTPVVELSKHAREFEERTGLRSRESVARERVKPLLDRLAKENANIDQAVRALASIGVGFRKATGGIAFEIGGMPVKVSLARGWSAPKLEAQFGKLPESAVFDPANGSIEEDRAGLGNLPEKHCLDTVEREYFRAKRSYDERVSRARAVFAAPSLNAYRRTVQAEGYSGSILDYVSTHCCFPSLEEWKSDPNADLPDPTEAFAKALGLVHLASSRFQPSRVCKPEISYPLARLTTDKACTRYTLRSEHAPLAYDYGERILVVRRDDDVLIRQAIRALAARSSGDAIAIAGATPRELKIAREAAGALNVQLILERRFRRAKVVTPLQETAEIDDAPQNKNDRTELHRPPALSGVEPHGLSKVCSDGAGFEERPPSGLSSVTGSDPEPAERDNSQLETVLALLDRLSRGEEEVRARLNFQAWLLVRNEPEKVNMLDEAVANEIKRSGASYKRQSGGAEIWQSQERG